MDLKNKRILITAGPTWVPLDKVRVISNIATGKTGILLAEKLNALGAKVTLILGPVELLCNLDKKIKIIRFKFFKDLKKIILSELRNKKYDILVHSAAVSDYRPKKIYSYKVSSTLKEWRINLVPTEKLINLIRKLYPSLILVGFKFEPDTTKSILIKKAETLLKKINLDLVVANTIKDDRYQAYIMDRKSIGRLFLNREHLVTALIKKLEEVYA